MTERDFAIVLYGATGFVGRQAAQYLAAHSRPGDLRWALAGRDRQKREAVKTQTNGAVAAVLTADGRDQAAVDAVVSRARVVLNKAGYAFGQRSHRSLSSASGGDTALRLSGDR